VGATANAPPVAQCPGFTTNSPSAGTAIRTLGSLADHLGSLAVEAAVGESERGSLERRCPLTWGLRTADSAAASASAASTAVRIMKPWVSAEVWVARSTTFIGRRTGVVRKLGGVSGSSDEMRLA
jgi:hypothetical protein